MKKVLLFHFASCPYCVSARRWIEQVKAENPQLRAVDIEMIDELLDPETADRYDYWYVPTFYVEGKKLHEGACSKEKVKQVLQSALE